MNPHPPPNTPDLLHSIKSCKICHDLPLGPRPLLQLGAEAPILIAGQAPGRRTHERGIPFADASGDRLRQWLGVSTSEFYDPANFSIVPMGFCYPGTGASGDLPPRVACAETWRAHVMASLSGRRLTLVIGQHAVAWHLPGEAKSLTGLVANWRRYWPDVLVLPHPSPRNNRWLKSNPWFETDILPLLRQRVERLLAR